ncbi:MAG TPA: hypothetical protein VKR55_26690 [Bradyrhizobium sp.]|uniref:hypothetical protein n=1 Tax=Bradyrhizobium sp. TaxID=376 RepID=UPI002BA9F2F8|nr:hypothetical protein [Bradyrhizobium sp.]HLZ05727.1 hypothetical protein [Bradyrhizobium sp.]
MRSILIAMLAAWASSAQALPCVLTEADYASIAQAHLHYNKAAIGALPPRDQRELCRARLLIEFAKGKTAEQIAQNCTAGDIPIDFNRYISSAEWESLKNLRSAVAEIMADASGTAKIDAPPRCTAKLGPQLR